MDDQRSQYILRNGQRRHWHGHTNREPPRQQCKHDHGCGLSLRHSARYGCESQWTLIGHDLRRTFQPRDIIRRWCCRYKSRGHRSQRAYKWWNGNDQLSFRLERHGRELRQPYNHESDRWRIQSHHQFRRDYRKCVRYKCKRHSRRGYDHEWLRSLCRVRPSHQQVVALRKRSYSSLVLRGACRDRDQHARLKLGRKRSCSCRRWFRRDGHADRDRRGERCSQRAHPPQQRNRRRERIYPSWAKCGRHRHKRHPPRRKRLLHEQRQRGNE